MSKKEQSSTISEDKIITGVPTSRLEEVQTMLNDFKIEAMSFISHHPIETIAVIAGSIATVVTLFVVSTRHKE